MDITEVIEILSSDEDDNDGQSLLDSIFTESHSSSSTASKQEDQGSDNIRMLVQCISDQETDSTQADDGDTHNSISQSLTQTLSGHVKEEIESSDSETCGVASEGKTLPTEICESGGLVSDMCSNVEQETGSFHSDDDDSSTSVHSQETVNGSTQVENGCGLDDSSCDSEMSLTDLMSPRKKQKTSAEVKFSSDDGDSGKGIEYMETCGGEKGSGMKSPNDDETRGLDSDMCLMKEGVRTEKNLIESNFERSTTPPTPETSLHAAAACRIETSHAHGKEQRRKELKHLMDDSVVETATRYAELCGDESQFLVAQTELQRQHDLATVIDDDDFFMMGANVRRAVFETFRIVELRKWQVEMLKSHINGSGALQNALIIAPTSSGKTLVAVILMLRCLIVQGRDAILALPFVAIVAEKVRDLKLLATKLSTFMVAEYAGRKGHFPPPSTKNHLRTLYVATTEKANVIWKLLCKTGDRKREIGILVFDEIHMIQQGMRGIVMEELVTSFLYWADSESRLVAMSATVGNEQDLRRFVGAGSTRRANIFHVTVRPAEVEEYMVVGGSALRIAKDANTNQRTVDFNAPAKLIVPDGDIFKSPDLDFFVEDDWRVIARLVFDAVAKNDPVLVFCGTKASCVQLCAMLTKAHTEVYAEQLIATDAVKRQRDFLIGHLKKESRGRVPSQLIRGIKCGIGFHSTELSETERKAIEGAYARGIINVITCTSTLAMGVNLPAMRVIQIPYVTRDVFVSCTTYIQMVGRAGRGCASGLSSCPDSFILLPPTQVSRFEALLKQGADNVLSQMLTHSMYYNRRTSGHDTKTSKQHEFNGVTRLLMTSLEIGSCDVLTLTDVISVFKLTLLYQIGEKRDEPESVTVRSIKPLLLSLQNLLRGGFVTVLSKARGQLANVSMEVEVVLRGDVPDDDDVLAHRHRVSDPEAWIPSMSHDTEGVKLAFDAAITGGKLQSCDFGLRLSAFAVATAAGSLSLDDAAEFVAEIEEYQECLCLRDYLIFLYISLTKDMCRPIVDPPTATRAVHDATSLIGDKIAKVYAEHPARKIFEMVGLEENKVNLWVRVAPRIRSDPIFGDKLTRMWSALFLNDLICSPDDYEQVCVTYGFDRGLVLELSTSLATRCGNLANFCLALDRYWWYPRMSSLVARKLQDAAIEEIRPLLQLNHVTPARAKEMLRMGLKTIRDVALVDPPLLLSLGVTNMPKWTAVEIVSDARLHIMQDALELAAESEDCRDAISRRPVTTSAMS